MLFGIPLKFKVFPYTAINRFIFESDVLVVRNQSKFLYSPSGFSSIAAIYMKPYV